MKANEIRIGNWVEQTEYSNSDIPFKKHIQFDESNWYRIGECIEHEEDFNPIQLTEEWLLRFGFIKDVDTDGDEYLGNNGVHVYWYEFASNTFNGFYFRREIGDELRVNHVHKLQNLYFALTGEELTINN